MLRIPCPWCGPRDETEFTFGGDAHVARPDPSVDDATWAHYLFSRANPKGVQRERWVHAYGCAQWFNVVRNTVDHAIVAVYRLDEPKPPVDG